MTVTIRTATEHDVQAMTTLHIASFSPDEHLGALLGPTFVRASYLWHVTDETAYAIVAELNGDFVGLLGMCDGPFTVRMLRGCSQAFVGALARRPRLLFDPRMWSRLARTKHTVDWVQRFCSTPGVAQMTIAAVDAKARGHSVFPELITRSEDVSRARGSLAIRAGVYRWNEPCQRAFRKCGWPESAALGSDETVYFVRVLTPDLLKVFPQLNS